MAGISMRMENGLKESLKMRKQKKMLNRKKKK